MYFRAVRHRIVSRSRATKWLAGLCMSKRARGLEWVWSTAYSICIQVRRNAGALLFVLRHQRLHSTLCANDLLAKCTLIMDV